MVQAPRESNVSPDPADSFPLGTAFEKMQKETESDGEQPARLNCCSSFLSRGSRFSKKVAPGNFESSSAPTGYSAAGSSAKEEASPIPQAGAATDDPLTEGSPGWHRRVKELRRIFGDKKCEIAETELRGLTLEQLKLLLDYALHNCSAWYDSFTLTPVSPDTVNLYHFATWCIKPATWRDKCSMVELIVDRALKPNIYVSHWWGEPMKDFYKCLKVHTETRGLEDASYWVCAHANRQWGISEELSVDPSDSSFFKAMVNADGILLVLDKDCTPFKRIWCAYEAYVGLIESEKTGNKLLFDFAMTEDSHAYLLTDGLTKAEEGCGEPGFQLKIIRERCFPEKVLKHGFAVEIEKAQASNEADKRHILNKIAGRPRQELELDVQAGLSQYKAVDRRIASLLARAFWVKAAGTGTLRQLGIPAALAADEDLADLCLDLSTLNNRDPPLVIEDVGLGLSKSLRKLNVKWCRFNAEASFAGALALSLKPLLQRPLQLQDLALDFSCFPATSFRQLELASLAYGIRCLEMLRKLDLAFPKYAQGLEEAAFPALFHCVSSLSRLQTLRLSCPDCGIGRESIAALCHALSRLGTLQHLELDFAGNFFFEGDSLFALGRVISQLSALQHLVLDLQRCTELADSDFIALARAAGHQQQLLHLSLCLKDTQIGDDGVTALCRSLSDVATLQHLNLNLKRCEISDRSLKAMGACISRLTRLQQLCLFMSCAHDITSRGDEKKVWRQDITDPAVATLGLCIEKVQSLQRLELSFTDCKEVGDLALATMNRSVSKLAGLQHLSQCWLMSDAIGDPGLSALGQALDSLSTLQTLEVQISKPVDGKEPEILLHISAYGPHIRQRTRDTQARFAASSDRSTLLLALEPGMLENPCDTESGSASDLGKERTLVQDPLYGKLCYDRLCAELERAWKVSSESAAVRGNIQSASNRTSGDALETVVADLRYAEGSWGNCLMQALSRHHKPLAALELTLADFPSDPLFPETLVAQIEHLSLTFKHGVLPPAHRNNSPQNPKLYGTDTMVARLGSDVSHMTQLRHLSLDFEWFVFGDKGLRPLAQGLASLQRLTFLSLDLFNKEIRDAGVTCLARGLAGLQNLLDLSLNFRLCESVGDPGVTSLSKALTKVVKLRHLSLVLPAGARDRSLVSTKGAEALARSLAGLQDLRHLNLKFPECEGTGDPAVLCLARALAKLVKLEQLSLAIKGSKGAWKAVSEVGVAALGQGVAKLQNLGSLRLSFSEWPMIGTKAVVALASGVARLSALSLLELTFDRCGRESADGMFNWRCKTVEELQAYLKEKLPADEEVEQDLLQELQQDQEKLPVTEGNEQDLQEAVDEDADEDEFQQDLETEGKLEEVKLVLA